MRRLVLVTTLLLAPACDTPAADPGRAAHSRALTLYSSHIERGGAHACTDPEPCDEIVSLLRSVPAESRSSGSARGLLDLIMGARQRLADEPEATAEEKVEEAAPPAAQWVEPDLADFPEPPPDPLDENSWTLSVIGSGSSNEGSRLRGRDVVAIGRDDWLSNLLRKRKRPPTMLKQATDSSPSTKSSRADDLRRKMAEREAKLHKERIARMWEQVYGENGPAWKAHERAGPVTHSDVSDVSQDLADVSTDGDKKVYHDPDLRQMQKELEQAEKQR